MDLKETFDRALDGGPMHPTVADRLVVGRRALRRRRFITAAAASTTAVIVMGGWAATLGASPSQSDAVLGAGSSAEPTPAVGDESCVDGGCIVRIAPSDDYEEPRDFIDVPTVTRDQDPLVALVDGELVPANGVTVVRDIRNPDVPGYRNKGPESAAVEVEYQGETFFVLTSDGNHGSAFSPVSPERGITTLEGYLAARRAADAMPPPTTQSERNGLPLAQDAPLVALAFDGTSLVRYGTLDGGNEVIIVDDILNPDLPDYRAPGVTTAAIEVTYQGVTWFVLTSNRNLGHTAWPASNDVRTLDDFIATWVAE